MCGIVAIVTNDRRVDHDALDAGVRALFHRGPDAQRTWISTDGHAGLGHARLSIIDLSTGDQPLENEDGRIHGVVNGELYGYERIQRELEARGHRLRTRSDSEIALHLYEDLGPACLKELRGEFAFVLWDDADKTLFAARDRFGIKPLFYAEHAGSLHVASEIKALFAAGVPARWDHESFFDANSLIVPRQDRTLFAGIRQVPPGHYLLARDGRIDVVCYWDFDYPLTGAIAPRSDGECAEAFHAALDEAVRLRLRADVPVGCYLSGGIDSCAVLGLAMRHRTTPIRTFTLSFDRAEYDEKAIAKEMAERCGAEFHPIPLHQSDLADCFGDVIAHGETLCLNAHGVAKFVLSRAVREAGYKVVLTGEGSDEILGGYPPFRRDMLLYDNDGQDPAVVRGLLEELDNANPVSRGLLLPDGAQLPLDGVRDVLGFAPSWMEAFGSTGFKLHRLFASDFAARHDGRDSFRAVLDGIDVAGQLTGRPPVHQSLYLWGKTHLNNYVLAMLGDRMEMAHSVEGRVPFLDHHLVELVRSLPVRQKIRGMTEKYVLREAARPVLTDTVYGRHKHPFTSPPVALAPDERLHELLQTTLRGPSMEALPFYDRSKVVGLLDSLPAMDVAARTAIDPALMVLLSACMLQERFRPAS
ncbi:MAG TPA: asparagine synthase (glutamine-hydrolyzing) [Candidatus Limnocylindrales bacterium]|nr:asparagine synthase (glutamine-hydrolyzing) [Candidatus Limnocylindrales bacterium]